MKRYVSEFIRAFQRPIGFLLLLLPSVALWWSLRVMESITQAANSGRAAAPDVLLIYSEIYGFFRGFGVPFLTVALVLAFLNLCYCFGSRRPAAV